MGEELPLPQSSSSDVPLGCVVPERLLACHVASRGRMLWIASDLHLGVPAPFGFPMELEEVAAASLDRARRDGAIIVLNGDILEDHAGVSPLVTLARYPRLRAALGEATAHTEVYYVRGNHDPDADLLAATLPWNVVDGLVVDEHLLVTHGDVFDAGLTQTTAGRVARLHAAFERAVGTPIDLPLARHGSLRNRAVTGLGFALAEALEDAVPQTRPWLRTNLDYLTTLEHGRDPRYVVATLAQSILPPSIDTVIAGHTHHPGLAQAGPYRYVNGGTFCDGLATVVEVRAGVPVVRDLVTGQIYGREAYARWEEREPWTTWWSRVRGELHPWSLLRAEVDKRRRPRPAAPPAPNDEEPPMSLQFTERMEGTCSFSGSDAEIAEARVELRGRARPDFWRSRTIDLDGTLDVTGFATQRRAQGCLRVGPQTWEYDLAFVGDDARPYRMVAEKQVRLFDLARSLTSARGDVLDAFGRSVAVAHLTFALDRDLGALIRSLTFGTREQTTPPRVAEPVQDPAALPHEAAVEGRWVAVTGAAGHVGHTLCKQLRRRGYSVLGLVRSLDDARAAELRALGVELREADVLAPPSIHRALEGKLIYGLFHTAAPFKLWARDEQREIVEPMVTGTLNVLRAAEAAGVSRLVYTSAGGAAGHDATGRDALDEGDWNRDRKSAYLLGKTEAEERVWEFAGRRDLDVVSVLPTAILGPYFFRHTPVTRLFEDVVDGRLPLLPQFAHSWVDVRDVARAQILLFESASAKGRYIVSATYRSWRSILEDVRRIDPGVRVPPPLPRAALPLLPLLDGLRARFLGSERTLTRAVVDELDGKEPRYSSDRLAREVGFRPIDFEQTLADTLRWLATRRQLGTFA